MSRQQHSSLLNALGLLSAGILLASPAIASSRSKVITQSASNAGIAQTPTVPTAPNLPTVPSTPTVAPTITPTVAPTITPTTAPSGMPTDTTEKKVVEENAVTTETKTIVDIASSNDSFKTLTAALKAAGLTETLAGEGPFTVFAPTDAAFAALPKGTVEKLLKPENKDKLIQVLTYHVVPGNVLAADLKTGNVKSLEGSDIKVKVGTAGAMVNNAKVSLTDVKASNGVIHAIDKVILPPVPKAATKPMTRSTPAPKAGYEPK